MTDKNDMQKLLAQKSQDLANSLDDFASSNYKRFCDSSKQAGLDICDLITFKGVFICGALEAIQMMLAVADNDMDMVDPKFTQAMSHYVELRVLIAESREEFGEDLTPDYDSLDEFGPKDSFN